MQVGLVGLPNVGKSALFKAMTGMDVDVSNYMFTTTQPVHGTAPVPDARLTLLGQYIETKKFVPATIELVDIPAIVTGSSAGEGMGNEFLSNVRQVDALAHVVRCFEDADVMHVHDRSDPARDVEEVNVELILADLQVLESARERAERRARTGDAAAKKRLEICARAIEVLEGERPLSASEWTPEQRAELRSMGMVTLLPVLYVANVGEDDLEGKNPMVAALREWVKARHGEEGRVVTVCAKLEAELADIRNEAERAEMLTAMGLSEPALAALARELYALLGLQSFYTAGPKEIRAWTIRRGERAPQAAGVIHSDIERGFIRCETYHVDDIVALKTEAAIRAAGKMRSEGKNYVMQDGDVCHFLFNV